MAGPVPQAPHSGRMSTSSSPRWNPGIIVQLIAVLSIAILVALAAVVSQHAGLPNVNINSNNNAPRLKASKSSFSSSSRRTKRDILSLEKELKSLANEYAEVTTEITGLTNPAHQTYQVSAPEKEMVDQLTLNKMQHNPLPPGEILLREKARQKFKEKRKKQKQQQDRENYNNMLMAGVVQQEKLKETQEQVNEKKDASESAATSEDAAANEDTAPLVQIPLEIPKQRTRKQKSADNSHDETFREPKKWWIRKEIFTSSQDNNDDNEVPNFVNIIIDDGEENDKNRNSGSIIPIDLSVNHLQRIQRAPGSPNNPDTTPVQEEFLPVVLSHEIDFRWRSRAKSNSASEDIVKISAYRIVARRAHSAPTTDGDENDNGDADEKSILWDSGKIETPNGLPDVVQCNDSNQCTLTEPGSIIEWSVTVWDSHPNNPKYTSAWTKFAIGPKHNEWIGQWISHPIDIENWSTTDSAAFWGNNKLGHQDIACENWEKRSQLPIFRAQLPELDVPEDDEISSVLLVVSGLGSFRASLDGVPLSSSGPLDPPLTDFSQRVSYRGFDVTKFLTGGGNVEHVLGISMGSGEYSFQIYLLSQRGDNN